VGAILDRNGLRPARYLVTTDQQVVMASETGVVDIDPAKIVKKGRLEPGRMFLINLQEGRIVEDAEIKQNIANLAIFIFKRTVELMIDKKPERLGVLININRQIAAGLRERPAAPQQPAPG
jgi:glutamate synthase (NADPH/NADH) large chain